MKVFEEFGPEQTQAENAIRLTKHQSDAIMDWLLEVVESPIGIANEFEKKFGPDALPKIDIKIIDQNDTRHVDYREGGDKRTYQPVKNLSRKL